MIFHSKTANFINLFSWNLKDHCKCALSEDITMLKTSYTTLYARITILWYRFLSHADCCDIYYFGNAVFQPRLCAAILKAPQWCFNENMLSGLIYSRHAMNTNHSLFSSTEPNLREKIFRKSKYSDRKIRCKFIFTQKLKIYVAE